ncbi:MAG: hypothetical protein PHY08_11890 [Candidatus Cloacimonetes bacterium]|nr:hypothetical protein [Candidatus Cloacimonadota bacterium]
MKNNDKLKLSINDVLGLLNGAYILRDDVTYCINKNKLKQWNKHKVCWQPVKIVKTLNVKEELK